MHVSYHYLIFNYKIVPRDPRKKLQILQIYNETGQYYENIISLLKFIIKLLILEIEFNLIIYIYAVRIPFMASTSLYGIVPIGGSVVAMCTGSHISFSWISRLTV